LGFWATPKFSFSSGGIRAVRFCGKRYSCVKDGEFMVLLLCRWQQRKVRRLQ
jgi:hypothetical protein